MTATELYSLLPIILISISLLILMMVIAFFPNPNKPDPAESDPNKPDPTESATLNNTLNNTLNKEHSSRLSFNITLGGLILTFISLFFIVDLTPQQATPLLLIDGYGLFFMGLILVTATLLLPLCQSYWDRHKGDQINHEFYLLYLLAILGALVTVTSDHFATFFLGIELLTLPLIVMVGYPFTVNYQPNDDLYYSPSLESAIKYLILSGAASATLLFGMALIYLQLGSLDFTPLVESLSSTEPPSTDSIDSLMINSLMLKTGIVMVVVGVGFKLSLVPFHLWTPDVYQGAPLPATAFLATISKGAVFALLLRYYLNSEAYLTDSIVLVIAIIAVLSMLIGNLLALFQQSLKRLLAYSSIAHFGYLLVALLAISHSMGSAIATEAVSYYLVAYLISTLAAFAILIYLPGAQESHHAPSLEDVKGLFWQHPILAIILTLSMLSLAGIPLTVGFIGKFYIFAAAVEQALWGMLLVAVIGSGIGLFYYLRVILIMTSRQPNPRLLTDEISYTAISSRIVLLSLAAIIIWLGIYPTQLIELIQSLGMVTGL